MGPQVSPRMMRRNTTTGMALAMAALLAGAFLLLRAPAAHADNSRWGANYFPNVELTTQDGKKVHFYDDLLKGKIVAINLIYTHCVDSCPLETARLVQVQKMLGDRMGKDIFFYSISIDPKRDTPEVLKDYAEKFHVGPGWTFLTGKKEDIDLVSRKLGIDSDPDPGNRDGHSASLVIGNEATGQWTRNAATDNPRFLSRMLTNFMTSGTGRSDFTRGDAQAGTVDFEKGRYFFGTRCAACHGVGSGDKIGPDLQGITRVRDRAWLVRMIMRPDTLLEEKDPVATALFAKYKQITMPNLRVSREEADAILNFLDDQAKAADAKSLAQGKSAPGGTAAQKRRTKGKKTKIKLAALDRLLLGRVPHKESLSRSGPGSHLINRF